MIIIRSTNIFLPILELSQVLKYVNARVMRKVIIYRRCNLKQYVLQNPSYKVPLI